MTTGLTNSHIVAFREEGVLVAEDLLTEADLAPVIAEYESWIDRRARDLQAEGKLARLSEGLPFNTRTGALYAQNPDITEGLDIMHARGPAIFGFLRNPRLLDAVESLIGPEITCSPIQHIRAKPPSTNSGTGTGFFNVPWHQDAGVAWAEADDSDIITCWLPLVDATVENGCMEVMPGAWRRGFLEHQSDGGTTIRPDLLPEIAPRAVPVRKGGVIFMHRYTPHRSTPNYTDSVRWSIDLRYQPTGTPTGRPFHPEFIVRSAADPATEQTSHEDWSRRWIDALESSKGAKWHRVKS